MRVVVAVLVLYKNVISFFIYLSNQWLIHLKWSVRLWQMARCTGYNII